jgi:signal transduction histidine kinase
MTRRNFRIFLLCLLGCLPAFRAAQAQEHPQGLPFLAQYAPADYAAAAQNWAVAQDARGVMFFGNNKGLLAFDATQWRLIPLPNQSAVRSLAADAQGQVWFGGQDIFGKVAADGQGGLRFQVLSDSLPEHLRDFGGVPNLYHTRHGVVFHTFRHLFLYENGQLKAISPQNRFQPAFYVRDTLYLNEEGIGLQYFDGEALRMLPNGQFFADKRVELVYPYLEAGTLLVGTEKHGLFVRGAQGQCRPFDGLPPDFALAHPIFSAAPLPHGRHAFGTHRQGLLLLDSLFRPIQQIGQAQGLRNNLIWGMGTDRSGSLWLLLDDGIAHVQPQAPFSYFATEGAVLSSLVYQNRLYLGTAQGVYETPWGGYLSPFSSTTAFRPVSGTEEQAWQLSAAGNGELLCGHIKGLYSLGTPPAPSRASLRWKGYLWGIVPIPGTPYLLAGTHADGLLLLEEARGQWQVKMALEGFRESARYLAVEGQWIWVSHPLKGVYRLRASDDWQRLLEIEHYGPAEGLPALTHNFVFGLPKAGVLFGTEQGIYRFSPDTGRFEPAPQFPALSHVRKLAESPDGDLWYAAHEGIGCLHPEGGRYKARVGASQNLRGMEIYSLVPMQGQVFIGTPNGLIRYRMGLEDTQRPDFRTLLRRITSGGQDSLIFEGAFWGKNGELALEQEADFVPELPAKLNALTFSCGAGWFEAPEALRFRYQLIGFDEAPSAWTANAQRSYTNLPAGTYTFVAIARNAYGIEGIPARYTFTILRPWHQTWWAYCGYALALAWLIWLSVHLYTRRLAHEKRRLEVMVAQKTEEIVAQSDAIAEQNERLAAQKLALEALNEEKSHLIGILAHDMRNPLHQIKASVDVLRMKNPEMPAFEAKFMGIIEQAVSHLSGMISKILDLEAIESQQVPVQPERLDWAALALKVAEGFAARASEKGIGLEVQAPDGPALSMADPQFAWQVLENLVSNALKFSPSGTAILILVRHHGGLVRVAVQDQGPGISPDDMPKLFGKFQKLSARPTAGEKSTGLGLSIVKKYAEAMDGRVWCESSPGNGAAFMLEFRRIGEASD